MIITTEHNPITGIFEEETENYRFVGSYEIPNNLTAKEVTSIFYRVLLLESYSAPTIIKAFRDVADYYEQSLQSR